MGSLGMPEILIILVIALIIFGPRKLPELGKTLGQSLAQFRRASEDFKRQWEDEVVMERHRIESPPPAPVEYSSYSDSGSVSAGSEEVQTSAPEETSPSATPGETTVAASHEETVGETTVAASHEETVGETTVAASHEETAVRETKHDWM